jgi:hypothetical protein
MSLYQWCLFTIDREQAKSLFFVLLSFPSSIPVSTFYIITMFFRPLNATVSSANQTVKMRHTIRPRIGASRHPLNLNWTGSVYWYADNHCRARGTAAQFALGRKSVLVHDWGHWSNVFVNESQSARSPSSKRKVSEPSFDARQRSELVKIWQSLFTQVVS